MLNCVAMPNLVEIGQNAAKLWRFIDFSRWRPPPSWIFKFQIFNGRTAEEADLRRCAKFGRNWSICGRDMAIFRFFKMAAVRHLGFAVCVFGPPTKGIWWSLSLCKIWLKSVKMRPRYGDFSIFQDGGRRHLGFAMCVFGPPTKGIWWSLSLCKIWRESMQ